MASHYKLSSIVSVVLFASKVKTYTYPAESSVNLKSQKANQ